MAANWTKDKQINVLQKLSYLFGIYIDQAPMFSQKRADLRATSSIFLAFAFFLRKKSYVIYDIAVILNANKEYDEHVLERDYFTNFMKIGIW